MINKIEIVNYRTFENKEFNLDKINVLIGPNSSGKSNFVHALRMICRKGMDRDIGNLGLSFSINDLIDKHSPFIMNVITESANYKWEFYITYEMKYFENGSIKSSPDNNILKTSINENSHPLKEIFSIGPKRLLPLLGSYKAEEENGNTIYNADLIDNSWEIIKDDIKKYLGFNIDKKPSKLTPEERERRAVYCQDLLLDKYIVLEHGNGIQEFVYLIMEIRSKSEWKTEIKTFLIEEPENHMHPRMQRLFLSYLVDLTKEGYQFVLTTHSSVFIDANLLEEVDNSKVFLLTKKDKKISTVVQLENNKYDELKKFLYGELGVRASDVLQANGIIWVEGPSDIIYLRKWLELYKKGEDEYVKYQEWINYAFMWYGGPNFAYHMDFDWSDLEEATKIVNLPDLNPNCVFLVDADKFYEKNRDKNIDIRTRIKNKLANRRGAYFWMTDNMTPLTVETKKDDKVEVKNKLTIECYLPDEIYEENKEIYHRRIEFAKKACDALTTDNFLKKTELEGHLKNICECIKNWNDKGTGE
ncbi:MAG: AAA family ATPase [Endomicrobiales bacterium]|nr:AAA family ATPase [Endomicrobiales bacterium]